MGFEFGMGFDLGLGFSFEVRRKKINHKFINRGISVVKTAQGCGRISKTYFDLGLGLGFEFGMGFGFEWDSDSGWDSDSNSTSNKKVRRKKLDGSEKHQYRVQLDVEWAQSMVAPLVLQ